MLEITPTEGFLFFGAIVMGMIGGAFGSFLASSFFEWLNGVREHQKSNPSKKWLPSNEFVFWAALFLFLILILFVLVSSYISLDLTASTSTNSIGLLPLHTPPIFGPSSCLSVPMGAELG